MMVECLESLMASLMVVWKVEKLDTGRADLKAVLLVD